MISIPLGSAGVHTEHTADPSRHQTSQEYGQRQRERQNHLYHSGLTGSTLNGMWEVDVTLIADWLRSLDQTSYEQVIAALEVLRDRGPSLGRPLVDTITASRHRNMKELRPGSVGRSEVRILFAFDPKRMAILLIAGDKAGSWTRWYKRNIPLADDLFDKHIRALRKRPEK